MTGMSSISLERKSIKWRVVLPLRRVRNGGLNADRGGEGDPPELLPTR
jgi:hypothetical protein